jgi:glycosyltransferase involved in cell wall biosynthesis
VKVAAIVGVKDEVELIQPCLERLWAVGVGPILVLDDDSSDGTVDVVDRLSSGSAAPLARTSFSSNCGQNMRVQGEVFGPFVRQHEPDWLLFIDADEFLICADDDLPTILASAVEPVLSIDRFNVALTTNPFVPTSGTEPSGFQRIFLITSREALSRTLLEESPNRRWIMHRIAPKLACRPECVAEYGYGWHSVSDARGKPIPASKAKGIVIAHLPMTTRDRFVRKVDNARDFFRRWGKNYPDNAAWHWRHWIDLADRGLLDAEFEAQRMDEAEITNLIDLGAIERADAVLRNSMRTDANT